MFSSIGFTAFDSWLMLACALGGFVGSVVQAVLATIKHDGPPKTLEDLRIAPPEIQEVRGLWLYMRLFVGAIGSSSLCISSAC